MFLFSALAYAAVLLASFLALGAASWGLARFSAWRARTLLGRSGELELPAERRYRRLQRACCTVLAATAAIGFLGLLLVYVLIDPLARLYRRLTSRLRPHRSSPSAEALWEREGARLRRRLETVRELEGPAVPLSDARVGTWLVREQLGAGKISKGWHLVQVERVDATGRWLGVGGCYYDRLTREHEWSPAGLAARLWPADDEKLDWVARQLVERCGPPSVAEMPDPDRTAR